MTQIEKLMATLKCSREEAEDIVKADLDIDRGKRTSFDLDPEAEKQAKKMANVGTKKASKATRKPKENPERRALIGELVNFLVDYGCVLVHCTNPERQIAFQIGENDYELTLVAKRKPKN